jgi:hypothetical protein
VQMRRLIREPLLHFFVLGAGLFAVFAWNNDEALQAPDDIVVDASRLDAIRLQFERVWQRPPTPEELQSLVDNWVREEILYREGLTLGLDRNDPVLRRRVAQKMEFISEELVEAQPDTGAIEAWFSDNAEKYRVDPRFSFRQLYLDPSAHGDAFEAILADIGRALASGDVPDGDATLLPAVLEDVTLADVRRTFGERFAESLQGLDVGEWDGPVASGYGLHFVHVDSMQASRLPDFEEVRGAVERDYRAERTRELKDAFYETLRKRYNVVYDKSITLANEQGAGERRQ